MPQRPGREEFESRLSREQKRDHQADDDNDQAEYSRVRLSGLGGPQGASRDEDADQDVDEWEQRKERVRPASNDVAEPQQLQVFLVKESLFLLLGHSHYITSRLTVSEDVCFIPGGLQRFSPGRSAGGRASSAA